MNYSDKQLQIIGAAEKLFAYNGFEGTSVRDIAENAGVNVAMISYYFGSKEKLLQALFEQRTQNLTMKIEGLLKDDTLTPFRKIEIVIDDYVERVAEKQRFYKVMLCEQMLDKNRSITTLLNELKKRNSDM
ncbi:MAG: TetR family transcriptional regulator, partial [Flavitalea sp.]